VVGAPERAKIQCHCRVDDKIGWFDFQQALTHFHWQQELLLPPREMKLQLSIVVAGENALI
jgi:hypothetical protein